MVNADHADTQDKLLNLWCHEESRVFRDRLISAEDRTWFNDALQVTKNNYQKIGLVPECNRSISVHASWNWW